ncbi:uncharacterized protein LOC130802219 isoform X1 [Amaranthus tricolor]|uniref:uncharacterized protein LOC130802219 isoform X1 n=1 Tax=Amaranthus tricolor TaxID=29722 RepID=UPI00258E6515|nr:uncharacterized protein LOC130802219 isoform X1 [Amaranthus tricolor]
MKVRFEPSTVRRPTLPLPLRFELCSAFASTLRQPSGLFLFTAFIILNLSNILVIIGTLLGIPGKSKDHKSARRDLKYLREEKDLRWVPELEVQELEDGSEEFPTSMLWMNDDEIEP